MLLKVVTKEEPSIRTLSYAPGPLNNEMQQHVRETLGDQEQKQLYTKMADEVFKSRN
jgi:sepiapterin reductase